MMKLDKRSFKIDLPNSKRIKGFLNCSMYFFHTGSCSPTVKSLGPRRRIRASASRHDRPVLVGTRSLPATSSQARHAASLAVIHIVSSSNVLLHSSEFYKRQTILNTFLHNYKRTLVFLEKKCYFQNVRHIPCLSVQIFFLKVLRL